MLPYSAFSLCAVVVETTTPIMGEQVTEENKRLLASQSDEEELLFPIPSRHEKRVSLSSTQYRTLRLVYFVLLHVILVLSLFGLLFQHLNYQSGLRSGIYSMRSTYYRSAYHCTKEIQLQFPVQLATL
jgi:hypothetical protein